MADVVTFDPINLRIVEISAAGDNALDVVEIYSEWKDWLLADSQRMGYPQAFTVVGGEPTSSTESLGLSYFISNGWKIRPAELSHKLSVTGNLFVDPATESAFVDTLGAFTVNTETKVSNLITQVSSGSGVTAQDKLDIADAVWDEVASGHVTAGSVGELQARLDALISSRAVAGQGLTAAQSTELLEIFWLLGLDPLRPVEVTSTHRRAPPDGSTIDQTFEDIAGVKTITRV